MNSAVFTDEAGKKKKEESITPFLFTLKILVLLRIMTQEIQVKYVSGDFFIRGPRKKKKKKSNTVCLAYSLYNTKYLFFLYSK